MRLTQKSLPVYGVDDGNLQRYLTDQDKGLKDFRVSEGTLPPDSCLLPDEPVKKPVS